MLFCYLNISNLQTWAHSPAARGLTCHAEHIDLCDSVTLEDQLWKHGLIDTLSITALQKCRTAGVTPDLRDVTQQLGDHFTVYKKN